MWKLTQTSWTKEREQRQNDRDFRSFVCLNVPNRFCEFWEWPAFYCMIIRWWCENLNVFVERDDAYTLKNATWIHIDIGKTSCEQQQFPCVWTWRQWRSGGNVSIKFVESLLSLKIPMRCIMHTSIFILRYNHWAQPFSSTSASHNALDISKYNMSAKTIHSVVQCTCESVCRDLLVSPECRQPEKTSRSQWSKMRAAPTTIVWYHEVAEENEVQKNWKLLDVVEAAPARTERATKRQLENQPIHLKKKQTPSTENAQV